MRTIQYPRPSQYREGGDYWMLAFAGMTDDLI